MNAQSAITTIFAMNNVHRFAHPLGAWIDKQENNDESEEEEEEERKDNNWFNQWKDLLLKLEGHVYRIDWFKAFTEGDSLIDPENIPQVVTPGLEKLKQSLIDFVSDKPIGMLMSYKYINTTTLEPVERFIQEILKPTYDIECKPVFIKSYGSGDDVCATVYPLDDHSIQFIVKQDQEQEQILAEPTKKRNHGKDHEKDTMLGTKDEYIPFVGTESNCFESFSNYDDECIEYIGYAMICRPKQRQQSKEDSNSNFNYKKQK